MSYCYKHTISYVDENDYGRFQGLINYVFIRQMILLHWMRHCGLDYLGTDLNNLLLQYSQPKIKKDKICRTPLRIRSFNYPVQQSKYLEAIRDSLDAVMCLMDSPQIKIFQRPIFYPEIEVRFNKEMLLNPLVICRNTNEKCLIETSINSIRISFKFKQSDVMEELIYNKLMRFIQHRAEKLEIIRRKAVNNYDLSFLITYLHLLSFRKHLLIDCVLQFVLNIDKEMNENKYWMWTRISSIAREWNKLFV